MNDFMGPNLDNFFGYGIEFRDADPNTASKNIGLTNAVCFECQKSFWKYPEHRYHREKNGRLLFFCSYSCLRKYDKAKMEQPLKRYDLTKRAKEKWSLTIPDCKKRISQCKEKLNFFRSQLQGVIDAGIKDKFVRSKLNENIRYWEDCEACAEEKLKKLMEENEHE